MKHLQSNFLAKQTCPNTRTVVDIDASFNDFCITMYYYFQYDENTSQNV